MKWLTDLLNAVRPHLPKNHEGWERLIHRFTFILWVLIQSLHTLLTTLSHLFRG